MTTIDRSATRSRTARLLEGAHRWGFFEESPTLYTVRTGVCARRLVVYPPGASAGERRALVFRRRWPTAGGMLALLTAMVAAPASPAAAIAAMLVVYGAGFVVAVVVTRGVWRSCRELRCSTVRLGELVETRGDARSVEACLAGLLALERARAAGRIDEVGFERGWWRIYDRAEPRVRSLD